MSITTYFYLTLTGLVCLLFFLRAVKLFFNGKILKHKIFDFPDDKYYKIGYCLCVCVLALVVIFLRID
jgi:hypothetical protein